MKQSLDEDSFAYALLHRGEECARLHKQPANAWFQNDDAHEYEVLEERRPMGSGPVLVLPYLRAEMFEVGPDWNVGRK